MRKLLILVGVAAFMVSSTSGLANDKVAKEKVVRFAFEDEALDPVTSPVLEKFSGEGEFTRYRKKLEAIKKKSKSDWASQGHPIIIAAVMQGAAEEDLCADPNLCPPEETAANIVVTASKATAPKSITNNQSIGVDEGDIVKQIGDYLLVLQDGRIFAVNIKTMALTDRVDVYRHLSSTRKKQRWEDDYEGADWYDEMLVQGDHILITAYSYADSASELSIFKLDQATGKISNRGIFNISSDDYYDGDNYATRIVGDRLVIYTPYQLEQFENMKDRPVLRRWLPQPERKEKQRDGKQLMDARSIYKPVIRTAEPTVHSVSICPLGDYDVNDNLECRTTGFLGSNDVEMFVSPDNVYLWNSSAREAQSWHQDECVKGWDWNKPYPALPRAARKDVVSGAVFRLPIRGGEPGVIGVSGRPFDQFSMDERDGQFRALVSWQTIRCDGAYRAAAEVNYVTIPQSEFSNVFEPVSNGKYTSVPSPGKRVVENRFADDWLIYGGRDSWSGYPIETPSEKSTDDEIAEYEAARKTKVIAVPVRHPDRAETIDLAHNIVRTERVGNDMMVNGYRDDKGLNMTLIGLGKNAKIVSSVFLDKRFESEGRSHAFNSNVDESGTGIIGVPTVKVDGDSGRWWWRSDSSDISFITKSPAGLLSDAGALAALPKEKVETHPDYDCEVSCIDWYGNSRPIFTDGRIFGLMGTGLVEAKITGGTINEVGRVDLTAPLRP
jgi:hypothetical protein